MKILLLTPRIPFPPIQGDRKTAYERIKKLSTYHEIYLVTFDSSINQNSIGELKKVLQKVVVVKIPKWKSIINSIIGIFDREQKPFQVHYFYSPKADKIIDDIIREDSIDIIHANYFRMAQYVLNYTNITLMDFFDSMSKNISSRLKSESLIYRIVYKIELKKVIRYENKIFSHFKYNLLISSIDRTFFFDSKKSYLLPLGVDLENMPNSNSIQKEDITPFSVIFIGNMSYTPNIEAISWFIDNCWTQLTTSIKDIRLLVVGASPSSNIILKYKKYENIEFTGFVKSINPYLEISSVSIAPMFSGSGMQNKILEAMAASIPVLATQIGVGDIKVGDKKNILVCNDADDFIKSIIKLKYNKNLICKIGNNGRQLIEESYSLDAHIKKLNNIYNQILDESKKFS